MLTLAKLRSVFDYFVSRVALVKIVIRLSLFLEYNLDLIYFAPAVSSLFFGKILRTCFLINFGLLIAKIFRGPVYT